MIFVNSLSIIILAVIVYLIIYNSTLYFHTYIMKKDMERLVDNIIGISFTEADSISSNYINTIFADEDGGR